MRIIHRNIELQFLAKVFWFHMKSAGFHEIRMKSGGFHEIQPKPCKIRRVFAETSASDFWNIWFHGEIRRISWNPLDFMDFMVKSARFHEIHRISWISWNPPISWWNLLDFMVKSAGFHEIRRISWTWAFGWWSSIGLSIERPIKPWLL